MRMLNKSVGHVLLLLICSVSGVAQEGSITGIVTDSTGAVVQGAEISVRNLGNNALRTGTTGATGAYAITNIPAGVYDVTARKDGFRAYRLPNVELTVAQALTVNAVLQPGATSEEVTVQADRIQDIDSETAQISNLVDQRQMSALPLITRDPYSLVLLSPGTSQTDSSHGGFSVNGARDRNNNFLLDGVDNNDTSVPGLPSGVLAANPDSTQEFRVITDTFNAEFGRNTGAIIDVITKSGSNEFHGSAYEFGRWNGFGGARDWFNPATGPQAGAMNPYVRNQFGYSIGGPIIKNKTFFFFNEEFDRFRTTLTNTATVPTQAFKTGLFTYTRSDGSQVPVDLTSANTQGDNPSGLPLDPTMQKVFALYPNPAGSTDGFSGTTFFPSRSATNAYNTIAKIDHHFTDRESLSLRYGYDHFFDPDPGHNEILPGGVGSVAEKAIEEGLSAQLTSTLRNNLVNNLQFGWNHVYSNFTCSGLSTLDSPLGVDQFGYGIDFGMLPFSSFGCTALTADGQFRKTGTVSYSEIVSWVHGNNTFKFGFDFRNVGENGADNFSSRRQFTTDAQFLFGTNFGLVNVPVLPGEGEPIQDAALALWGFITEDLNAEFFNKSAVRQSTNNKFLRQHEFDWFAQDAWKVRRNLTLTLGLRYQLNGVPYEQDGDFSNLLQDPGSFAHGQPVVFSTVGPGTGRSMYQPDYNDLEPRVGFSWDPWSDGKTAVRAAFGIFHDRVFGNLYGNARGLPPFEQDYNNFPLDTIGNAFGTGGVPSVVPNTTPTAVIPDGSLLSNATILDTRFRNAAANNWNLNLQHEFRGNNIVDVSYVGSMGVHVWSHRDGNPPDPALVQQLVTFCSSPNTFNCTPASVQGGNLYEGFEFGALPFDAVNNNALLQPAYQQSEFNSMYHGLQTKITHRFRHGASLQGAYTWSHAIDNGVDPLGPAVGAHTFPRNSRNLAQNRGNSDNDTRHVAVLNYIWQVPLGSGQSHLNSGLLGKIFEGMQFSGITTIQSGHPLQIRSALDSQRTGIPAWGLRVGDPFGSPSSPSCAPDPSQGKVYLTNRCAYVEPPFGSAGSGRNQLYGPGFWTSDLVFSKTMKLSERFRAELRVEGYNIFNHPHFLNPGTDANGNGNLLESALFGVIQTTATEPDGTTSARQMQVALRLTF